MPSLAGSTTVVKAEPPPGGFSVDTETLEVRVGPAACPSDLAAFLGQPIRPERYGDGRA